ncbi:MAG TPA: LptE family protein [Ignavibacteriaceae bacterium]|nr:LptE family protein [Ignavibacteriaceae bacterium]
MFITLSISNFGCCFYSFTGASVPQHLKTIAIPVADDRSGSGEPGLRELLTDQLTQKFIEDNTLQVTERTAADAILENTITSLTDAPAVVAAGETVETRRVTLTINVIYRDLVQRKIIYNKSFSNYGDYSSGGSIAERRTAIETAVDRITEDILLDTVSGW